MDLDNEQTDFSENIIIENPETGEQFEIPLVEFITEMGLDDFLDFDENIS